MSDEEKTTEQAATSEQTEKARHGLMPRPPVGAPRDVCRDVRGGGAMNFNAIDTHTNVECEVNGERLIGYVVDDGERWWVWARDERDARLIAGLSAIGIPLHEATYDEAALLYEETVGEKLDDAWVCPLTVETLEGVTFRGDDGTGRPMADEMRRNQARGLVASSCF